MTPILSRPIYLRLCCVIATAAVTVAILGGVALLADLPALPPMPGRGW